MYRTWQGWLSYDKSCLSKCWSIHYIKHQSHVISVCRFSSVPSSWFNGWSLFSLLTTYPCMWPMTVVSRCQGIDQFPDPQTTETVQLNKACLTWGSTFLQNTGRGRRFPFWEDYTFWPFPDITFGWGVVDTSLCDISWLSVRFRSCCLSLESNTHPQV
jgi:hypothetical protein